MRKKLLSRFMLLVAMLLTGVGVNAADKWVKTSITDLATGDIVVIVDQTSSCALSNDNGTSVAPKPIAVTLNNDKSEITSEPAENVLWRFINSGTNAYKFQINGEDKYLYSTNSNNGIRVGTGANETFCIEQDTQGNDFLKVKELNRYVGIYNNQDWRSYTSIHDNIKDTRVAFYKKTDDSTPSDTRANADLSFDPTSIAANLGEEFIAPTLNNPNNLTVTWTSDNANVAEVATDGTVTLKGEGTAEITATFEGNDKYKPGSASYTITVTDPNKPGATAENPYTVEGAIAYIQTLGSATSAKEVYVKGIVSQVDSYNSSYKSITYWISDDGKTDNQMQVYSGKGLDGADFSAKTDLQEGDEVIVKGYVKMFVKNETSTPEFDKNNIIVYFKEAVVDPVEPTMDIPGDAFIKYGENFTLNTDKFLSGDITLESSNEKIATVDGLTITPQAVGQVTITVKTAANEIYLAGEGAFTLVIENPDVETSAPTISGEVFNETFDKFIENTQGKSTNGGNDGAFSGTVAATQWDTVEADNEGWNVANGFAGYQCAKFGSSKNAGSATTPSISVTEGTTYTLTFKAAPWAEEATKMIVSVEGGSIESFIEGEMTVKKWNEYKVTFTATSNTLTITFTASNNRFFLDEVQVALPSTEAYTETATLNGNGFATHASIYPLDFSAIEGATAWIATAIEGTTITFEQLNAPVAGGTGVLLKGEANAEVTIPGAEKGEEADGNIFISTLAPTYVVDNQYYGLYNENFVRVSESVAKENKALLPAGDEEGVKAFTLVFNGTDGVKTIETVSAEKAAQIFDLSGRRLSRTQKGVNIINGKKVMLK